MIFGANHELFEAEHTLTQLAEMVEHFGLTAADVAGYIMNSVGECEDQSDMQRQLLEMTESETTPKSFARGLRRQAAELRRQMAG